MRVREDSKLACIATAAVVGDAKPSGKRTVLSGRERELLNCKWRWHTTLEGFLIYQNKRK